MAECRKSLTCPAAVGALAGRGLSPEYALRAGLGWNTLDRFDAPELWGMEPWLNDKGRPGKIALPAGMVLPTRRKAGVVSLKIRRAVWTEADPWPKYHAVRGGGNGPLVLGKPGLPLVIVESELDGLLIFQEAPDLVAVAAMGSAGNKPTVEATQFLKSAPLLLVALDADDAGRGAVKWWTANFSTARRCPPIQGKDPGDMHKGGIPVRAWIEAGLMVAGMPRQEALQGAVPAQDDANIGTGEFVPSPGAYAFPAGDEESFRGEPYFPGVFSDPVFRMWAAGRLLQ
jgi:hypothetical protein